jgi:hypothetical protein
VVGHVFLRGAVGFCVWRESLFAVRYGLPTDTVRTSQETHHVSTTEPNRLLLCGETVAVCCENRTEHRDTVRTSQETHHISTTEPNRLMLCGETVAVCCENRTEHIQSVPHRRHIHCVGIELLMLKHVVHIVTTELCKLNTGFGCVLHRQ